MGDAAVERWLASRTPEHGVRGRLARGAVVGEWRVGVFLGAGLSAEVYRVTNITFVNVPEDSEVEAITETLEPIFGHWEVTFPLRLIKRNSVSASITENTAD